MQKFISMFFACANPVRTVVYVMVIMALANSSYKSVKIIKLWPNRPGVVESKAFRFSGLKATIRQQDSVGYLTGHKQGSVEEGTAHFLAQYHLAPIVVDKHNKDDLLVGDFPTPLAPKTIRGLEQQLHLQLTNDYKNGIMLFRKVTH